jgi:amino acid transporter/mannitol/fructose-specific phosphotransferase system IIA component (Ntr-type)
MALKRELKLLDVFCIASGAMISSGLFILPGLAYAKAGPSVYLSYLVAGLLAVTGMLSQAELVSAMPKAGGTYFYVKRSLGPAVGTVDGLITWFSLSLKSAFALVGMAAFTSLFIHLDVRFIALALTVIFIVINMIGVKEAGRTQIVLVICLLAALILYIVRGLPEVRFEYLEPFAPQGTLAIISTAGFVFVSYGGLLKVASVAEEVQNPGRVIPLAMILSLIVVTIVYMLAVFVTAGVLPGAALDNSYTPITDGAGAFMGQAGRIIMSLAAILAFVSTANAGIMAASRYPLALSRDGLLPEHLGMLSERFKTPSISILITGAFLVSALFLKLDVLVKAASTVLILTYIFSCLSIIILRESRIQNYQPVFKAPLYPWLQIAGIIALVFLLFEMGKAALFASAIVIVAALFVYWFYGRIRAEREFALLHIIERVTAKELTSYTLESELKDIIRERDEIVKDSFDHLVERGTVLDIEQVLPVDEFFEIVAESMAPKLGIAQNVMLNLLWARENESSTVLTPTLAIPHIILDGEHTFEILMARSRQGVRFSDEAPAVHAVFVLAGTKDERNFHLRALSAIAQIVQDPHFDEKWMAAKGEQALRDIVLLGKRRR